VKYTYWFVHAVAHSLGNPQEESAAVARRVNGALGAMQRYRNAAGTLTDAFAYFLKVTRSYRHGLFDTYALPDLPRTNNGLEQLFGSQRCHERRATGRKTAAPGRCCAVSSGCSPPQPHACRRPQPESWEPRTGSTGGACANVWREVAARTLCTRFRHDLAACLVAVEQQACQLALPSSFLSATHSRLGQIAITSSSRSLAWRGAAH
jgi:hypothetical protein